MGWLSSDDDNEQDEIREKSSASKLSHITCGLQHAAAITHGLMAEQYIKLLDQFFDRQEPADDAPDDETPPLMKAKMVHLELTPEHQIAVPLVALVAPRGLSLESMVVEMSVQITGTELATASNDLQNSQIKREGFMVKLDCPKRNSSGPRDPNEVALRLEFKASEPSEAIRRVIEEYTNLILPREVKPTPPPPPVKGTRRR